MGAWFVGIIGLVYEAGEAGRREECCLMAGRRENVCWE